MDSGDFVVDRFQTTTRSPYTSSQEASMVSVVVDPGTAYIAGYRVQTTRNTVIDIPKGIDTDYANTVISVAYGDYV